MLRLQVVFHYKPFCAVWIVYCSVIYLKIFLFKKKVVKMHIAEYDTAKVCIDIFWFSLTLLWSFWVPACTCSVSYPSSGIWVQHSRQTVYTMEPDHPEAGVSSSLAPKGYSHHTYQFSSQETNAHPSSWCVHVLHHRQVVGEFFTTTTCAVPGSIYLGVFPF